MVFFLSVLFLVWPTLTTVKTELIVDTTLPAYTLIMKIRKSIAQREG